MILIADVWPPTTRQSGEKNSAFTHLASGWYKLQSEAGSIVPKTKQWDWKTLKAEAFEHKISTNLIENK